MDSEEIPGVGDIIIPLYSAGTDFDVIEVSDDEVGQAMEESTDDEDDPVFRDASSPIMVTDSVFGRSTQPSGVLEKQAPGVLMCVYDEEGAPMNWIKHEIKVEEDAEEIEEYIEYPNIPNLGTVPLESNAHTVVEGTYMVDSGGNVINIGEAVINSGEPAINSGEVVSISGETAVISGGIVIQTSDTVVISGAATLDSGAIAINSGETTVNSGETVLNSGDTAVNSGETVLFSGDTAVNSGETLLNSGDTALQKGDVAVNSTANVTTNQAELNSGETASNSVNKSNASSMRGKGIRKRGRLPRNFSRIGPNYRDPKPVILPKPKISQRGNDIWQIGDPLEELWRIDAVIPKHIRKILIDDEQNIEQPPRKKSRIHRDDSESESEYETDSDSDDERVSHTRNREKDSNSTLLEEADRHFKWLPMDSFRGEEETFKPESTGAVTPHTNPYDAFRAIWTDDILQFIADETNLYATDIDSSAFQADWYPTNTHEVMCLFAFWIMTGIIRMPTMDSYFSCNTLLKTEIFSRITSAERYGKLQKAFQFIGPAVSSFNRKPKSHRLKPIIDHLNAKFQFNYVMEKDICIDESLTLWGGKLRLKHYISSNRTQTGIKTYQVCESSTGYLWSFILYTGKDTEGLDLNLPERTAVVLKLMKPLLNLGHRVFMDNWYNSPYLARYLKRNGTDLVGTLNDSHTDIPKLVMKAPLKPGQIIGRHSGDVCVMTWQDRKRVHMISTCHGIDTALPVVPSNVRSRPVPFRPQAVLDYNNSMGGVDLKDQLVEPYLLERNKCTKWYVKLFKRLLNDSIHNARILVESSTKVKKDDLKFRLELVSSILNSHHTRVPVSEKAEATNRRTSNAFPHLLEHCHWPVRVKQTGVDVQRNRKSRRKCAVCLHEKRREQRTPFMCETCEVPVCIEDCYKKYHTNPEFATRLGKYTYNKSN